MEMGGVAEIDFYTSVRFYKMAKQWNLDTNFSQALEVVLSINWIPINIYNHY